MLISVVHTYLLAQAKGSTFTIGNKLNTFQHKSAHA